LAGRRWRIELYGFQGGVQRRASGTDTAQLRLQDVEAGAALLQAFQRAQQRAAADAQMLEAADHQLVALGHEIEDRIEDYEVLATRRRGILRPHDLTALRLQRGRLFPRAGRAVGVTKPDVADPEHPARHSTPIGAEATRSQMWSVPPSL
jgi:hypothetical protein